MYTYVSVCYYSIFRETQLAIYNNIISNFINRLTHIGAKSEILINSIPYVNRIYI